ncbi:MAG: dTDP-4-dehydrorhamnose reductase [Alphaproteobacteria bacterium]|nr:dTDP-4-dehydrorhamnose reductase [Alphaproteobacteria bacterium]
MTILLFGKNGQVGSELQRALAPLGKLVALDRQEADFTKPDQFAEIIRTIKPKTIVNAAAYTAVDKAENDKDTAFLINATAPEIIAKEAQRCSATLIHYSTDYVFDGAGTTPFKESDATHPLNIYGHSKKAGEDVIVASGCNHIILRTSWVYGATGKNFAKTMIELAQTRDTLNVVYDQIGAPTGAALLADCTAQLLKTAPHATGLFHLAATGETSWYDYARFVLDTAQNLGVALKLPPDAITPVSSKDYKTPAARPLNSRLNITKFQETFGITLPPWQEGVTAMLKQLYER